MNTDEYVWTALAGMFEPKPDYLADPVRWIDDTLDEFLWSKQREVAQSVVDNRYTAVQSCHDAGKSFIASRTAAWWLATHPVGEAFVVSTAPTAAQVDAILWREIAKAHRKGGLAGRILGGGFPQWKIGPELVGYGRKPADHDSNGFQGIHARYVLIIIDEACGIPKTLWDAVDALATNEAARVLAIGNPDDPGTQFRVNCAPGSGWHTIRIDGLQSPNVCESEIAKLPPELEVALRGALAEAGLSPSTEEVPDELREYLISATWIAERVLRWKTKSALFLSKVRGIFPDDNAEGVIPLGWVERAIDRWNEWDRQGRPELPGRKVVSCDVARFGADNTCIGLRQGPVLETIARFSGLNTVQTADKVREVAIVDGYGRAAWPHTMFVVDVVGVGAGVVDNLRHEKQMPNVVAFNASRQDKRVDDLGQFKFNNNRSAAWWNLRELLAPQGDPMRSEIMLPDDEDLKIDLTAPKYKVSKTGGIIEVESKDDIRKRIGRSPDSGDMAVMAFYYSAPPPESADNPAEAVDWTTANAGENDVIPWG